MKKIFLYAYDGVNLGDDLFVHALAYRYPEVRFYLWSPAIRKITFSCLKNVVVWNQNSRWIRFLRIIRPSLAAGYKARKEEYCDAVVYIGGSLFIEYENWRQINTWWEYEALNRNFYVLGANFGPFHTDAYKDSIAKVFANMKDVCLRDMYSQSLFSDVETVRYAPDILFTYPMKSVITNEKQVFVSVIDCNLKNEGDNKLLQYDKSYTEIMISVLNDFISKGYKVVLSSFCKAEGDENAVNRIYSKLPDKKVTIVNYNGTNSQEVLDQISESNIVIASRFHATILGFVAEKPVLPVIYSDKTKHVLDDIGFKGKYLDIRHLEKIDVDSLITNTGVQRLSDIDRIRVQAESHFMKLDQLLKRE